MVVLLAAACGGEPALGAAATVMSSTTGDLDGTTGTASPPISTTSGTPPATSATSSGDGSSDDAGSDFITRSDGGSVHPYECDLFEQDCPRGEKCAPWANDGGASFSATRCVPVAPNPAGVGEPCTVQGNGVSGIDDCDLGSMCWDLGGDLEGECIEICGGTARAPECPRGTECTQNGAATLVLCRAQCDPLTDECGEDVCVLTGGTFSCVPDASRPGATHGTPCEFINACPSGTLCIGADAHTKCASNIGCCSTVCDVTSAEDPCPALDPGQSCESWFAPGMAPSGLENLGVCALPR